MELILTLLRHSLSQQPPSLPDITTRQWEEAFRQARKAGVVTLVNDAIEMLPPEQRPQGDIALSWALSAERTRYHFEQQRQVLDDITRRAHEAALPLVLLKGMSLARLYPNPSSRACGDIDLCFPDHYAEGNALLGHPDAPLDGIHSEFLVNDVPVENHLYLLNQTYRSQRRAEQYIRSTFAQASAEGYLPPMGDMVYLLMHTVGHLTAKYKLPLRNLVDWGMFLWANRHTLEPAECHRVVRHIGMEPAFNLLTLIAGDFIGQDLSAYVIGRVRQEDLPRMRRLILTQEYLPPMPKGLSLPRYIATRLRRNRSRQWLMRYLPSTAMERLWSVIRREAKL